MEKTKPQRCWCPILTPIPIAPRPGNLDPPNFTESELAVAQQLIHLSESSGPSVSANSMGSASSSSTRSVMNIQASTPPPDPDDMVELDDGGLWRRIKRYRPIADVYASTAPIGDHGVGNCKKERQKRRGRNMEESARDQSLKIK